MNKTTFNISEVSRLTGKARSTITNHITKRKLSFILDDNNNKLIEASELTRVYGDFLQLDENGKLRSNTKRSENKGLEKEQDSNHLQDLLDREQKERERERNQLLNTIEQLRGNLEKSEARESRGTALLENQTKLLEHQTKGADEWKQRMEERIEKQEDDNKKYRKALRQEQNKTLWQKLFR